VLQSVTQADKFFNDIIPLESKITKRMYGDSFNLYKGPVGAFYCEELKSEAKDYISAFTKKYINDIEMIEDVLNMQNSLENLALCFIKGVANESLAFSSIGKAYCNSVKYFYPFIAFARNKGEHNYFDNLCQLYAIWSDRVNKINLKCKVDLQQKDLEDMLDQLHGIKDKAIKPLGAE